MSTTVYRGGNIALAPLFTWYHLSFTSEEFAAVLRGRTPLVDFVPQYVSLLPYLAWPFLTVAGFSVGTLTVFFAGLSGIALLSVLLAFRTVTGSARAAVLLYLPFLSVTFFPAIRDGAQLHSVGSYYALLPLRYFFPLLLTGLVAALAPRTRAWRPALVLGATAGAGLVNNVEFGIAALGAAVVAVFVAVLSTQTGAGWLRNVVQAELRVLVGAASSVLLFVLGTLLRSGSLPDFTQSFYFSRQFAASGFFMLPMPGPLGLHLVMYLTGALALVLALVAAVRRSPRPGAAGPAGLALLAYSSVFGLGAGSYYVGRSHPLVLIAVFCAWALCSAALTVEVIGRLRDVLAAGTRVRLLMAAPVGVVAALFTLGVTTLSGADVLAGQPDRVRQTGAPVFFAATDMRQLVSDCARPNESVMLLHPLGHWISADLRVRNAFPYNHVSSVVTRQQVSVVVASLRENDVTSVFAGPYPNAATGEALTAALQDAGYRVVAERPATVPSDQAAAAAGPMVVWRRPSVPGRCA